MSRRTNSRSVGSIGPEVEMSFRSDLSAGLHSSPNGRPRVSPRGNSRPSFPSSPRGGSPRESRQTFEADAAALRVRPRRTVPLAILVQSFLVVVVIVVALSVSTLIYSYAMRTINPITARYCKALSQDVADGAAMIIRDATNAISFVHFETDSMASHTIEDVLVQCQDVSLWLFESIYFANDTMLIAAESYTLLHLRHLPTDPCKTCWDERTTFLPGHGQHGDDVESQVSEFEFSKRPWYQNATLGRTKWTGLYKFYPSGHLGMTISYRGPLGVLSVDYSMEYFKQLMYDFAVMDFVTNSHQSVLHPEVGLFDTRTRKWVVTSLGSKVLGNIPDAQLPALRYDNCSTLMTVDNVEYFSYCVPVMADGDNIDFVAVTVLVQDSVLSYLYIAIRDVVLLAGGAAVVILLFSAFLVRLTARPFSALSKRMREVSHMNLDSTNHKMERARFRELDEMQLAFEEMVRQLEQLKQYLPDTIDDNSDARSGSGSDNVTITTETVGDHTRKVHTTVTYMSRATSQVKVTSSFEFIYRDDDNGIFTDLVRNCLETVGEHPFQDVKLEAELPGEAHPITVSNTKQLEDLFVLSPYELRIIMSKSNTRNLLTPVMASMDGANFIATIMFTAGVLSQTSDSDKNISGTTFVFLYFFALVGNLLICLMLIRDASEQEKMHRWIGQSPFEVGITLFMSMFKTQNLQLLWSNLRFGRRLRFNAPMSKELMRRCVVWSLFGFVFCDMMQLSFKVYISRKAGFGQTNVISLITSSMAMMFDCIKKFAVLSLWQKRAVVNEGMSTTRQRRGAQEEHRSCPLRMRPVSLLLIVHQPPKDIFPSSFHVGVELNRMYELVFAITKHHMGAIVSFSNGEIVVAFNAVRSLPLHTIEAVRCAVSCATALHATGIHSASCVATLDCPVGTLGSSSRRSFHCFAATRRMHRMVALAGWVNADILCTKSVHNEMLLNLGSILGARTTLVDQLYDCGESAVYEILYEGKPTERYKGHHRFRALGKLTSGLSMRNDAAPAFLEKFVTDVKNRLAKTTRVMEAEEKAMALESAAAEAAGKTTSNVAAAVTKLLGSIQNPQARKSTRRPRALEVTAKSTEPIVLEETVSDVQRGSPTGGKNRMTSPQVSRRPFVAPKY